MVEGPTSRRLARQVQPDSEKVCPDYEASMEDMHGTTEMGSGGVVNIILSQGRAGAVMRAKAVAICMQPLAPEPDSAC